MLMRQSRRLLLSLALAISAPLLLATSAAQASTFDLPPLDRIVSYAPKLPLQVFTADGVEIAQFGTERRVYVPLAQTPQQLKDAVLAVEDSRFYEHSGIDPKGMARAAVALLTGGRKQGASTITQQLVRTMLLTRELSAERKAKEILLALRLEQAISKDRILEIYLNEIFLGQRAYGFAAAAQAYFGKSLDKLTLAETAMLAGLPQNPYYANPVANLDRAVKRQRVVLERMRAVGVIDERQLAAAKAEKLQLRTRGPRSVNAAHVAEMARRAVVERFGTEAYSTGLKVTTSLKSADQRAAHEALQRGVLAHDRRGAWRGPESFEAISGSGAELERAAAEALKDHRDDETLRVGIVLAASPNEVRVQLASGEQVRLQGEGLRWAQRGLAPKAKDSLKLARGSVIRVVKTGKNWSISQWPEVEAALVAVDAKTGRVRALVGGFDFSRQPFNHVTQSWRQPGSAFKPLLYSAALEERVMPGTLIDDLPYTAPNGWSPGNSNGEFAGPITLRTALAKSSNLASVRVLQHMGTQRARDWTSRFGMDAERHPNDLTLALGTGSTTPMQMAQAYATLANGGWRVEPVVVEKITDAHGKVLFEAPAPAAHTEDNRVIPARNAYVTNSLLNEVVRTGTAARAQALLKRSDIYGKTGTTNDVQDAWFAGHHPSLATVVWMGHDQPRSLGNSESGGRMALPIWIDYMAAALKDVPNKPLGPPPAGLVREGDDWLYSEWREGGWVAHISDPDNVEYAPPPGLFWNLRSLFSDVPSMFPFDSRP
ncbi:penicillin-binding protein 1A [Hydrogenophaga palleronii]|uniref:Penicillin-binding protein 1A n=1 Tax=Hydrogenophaga palleronii TaxID=65655 RepID=A0ABU1WJQ7_9BURK|nr:PBP1A family penicillin-binding protein [Hydrogenophaga palleronii]MDR7149266.1 penicillin-binding protein 1A [Hydrogenophaga palleronii]